MASTYIKKRDSVKTRQKLIAVGTHLFSRRGYAGCTVDDIVAAAKVNKRMAYHYFGNKEGLYREIFALQWNELAEWFEKNSKDLQASGGAAGGLNGALLLYSGFLSTHQDFVRLMMWEALEGGKISRSLWSTSRGPLFEKIRTVVERAQAEGRLSRGFDPGHFIISFMGIVTFYFAYASTISDILQKPPLSESALKERNSQIKLFLDALIH